MKINMQLKFSTGPLKGIGIHTCKGKVSRDYRSLQIILIHKAEFPREYSRCLYVFILTYSFRIATSALHQVIENPQPVIFLLSVLTHSPIAVKLAGDFEPPV